MDGTKQNGMGSEARSLHITDIALKGILPFSRKYGISQYFFSVVNNNVYLLFLLY
jgi:hypothetical protein